ncbi:MAG: glycoside hydrolase family 43 protein [Planctomycetes bacterium]|nr:glycoside hydrolase family 43 protein [Planctomycetota bacterium]
MLDTITKIARNVFLLFLLGGCSGMTPDWSFVDFSPLDCITTAEVTNPVLTASDVNRALAASVDPVIIDVDFVADPFLYRDGDTWYMFFEVAKWGRLSITPPRNTHWGRIGLATSPDGLSWTYDRIVMDDIVFAADGEVDGDASVHHSYPQVFKYGSNYYMVTEAFRQDQIRFYRASDFPYDWEWVYTLWKCGTDATATPGACIDTPHATIGDIDPTIIRYNGKWWMFASANNRICYLYYSDNLLDGWVEHPQSPIATDSRWARPAGRAFVYADDQIIRLAQKCNDRYGQRVKAFLVTTLTETEYVEEPLSEGAPFCPTGWVFCETGDADSCERTGCADRADTWNLCGMHHFDAWWTGTRWLIVTDGHGCLQGQDSWSIGIFQCAPDLEGHRPFEERDIEIRQDVR